MNRSRSKSKTRRKRIKPVVGLRKNQYEPLDNVLKNLKKYGKSVLKAYCGFGKTIVSLYAATHVGFPTLIILPQRIVNTLIPQWRDSAKRISNEIVFTTYKNKKMPLDYDIFVSTPNYIKKYMKNSLSKFRFVILDELHCFFTAKQEYIFKLVKRIPILGLSATPKGAKNDIDKRDMFLNYFNDDILVKVYKIQENSEAHIYRTTIVPETRSKWMWDKIVQRFRLSVDWQFVCDSVDLHSKKNKLIVDTIIPYVKKYRTLILSRRHRQVELLYRFLKEKLSKSMLITKYTGKDKLFYPDSDIVIATDQKAGIGFDWDDIECIV